MLTGNNPLVPGDDRLRVLEVLEAIKEYVDEGGVVKVKMHNVEKEQKREDIPVKDKTVSFIGSGYAGLPLAKTFVMEKE